MEKVLDNIMINNPQIKVKIIADSINAYNGVRITTFEYEAPKFLLQEINTHRTFSRNAASSRAIPVKTILKQIWKNPFTPTYWGKNQSGMQADLQMDGFKLSVAKLLWNASSKGACVFAYALSKLGMHKQIVNRIIEPWVLVKGVITATELDNWYDLRLHADAQPEIQDLSKKMHSAQVASTPRILYQNQWHVPYVTTVNDGIGEMATQRYFSGETELSLEDALKISSSCCAQVSYRRNDTSLEKAKMIYDRLVSARPLHASPFEHAAVAVPSSREVFYANFRGWKQYRKTIESQLV